MLTEIQPIICRDPRDLRIERSEVGQIAGADGVDHDLEFAFLKHVQAIHGGLDRANHQAAFLCHESVEFQLGRTEVDHRHVGSCRRIERSLPAASRGQTQQSFAAKIVSEPAVSVQDLERMGELVVGSRAGESLPPASELIPSLPIVGTGGLVA